MRRAALVLAMMAAVGCGGDSTSSRVFCDGGEQAGPCTCCETNWLLYESPSDVAAQYPYFCEFESGGCVKRQYLEVAGGEYQPAPDIGYETAGCL